MSFEQALILALLTRLDRQIAPATVNSSGRLVSVGPLAETSLRRYLAG